MKKYISISLWIMVIMLTLSTLTYGWFTYVLRKSVATFYSNEISVLVSLNDEVINESTTLSNLAFIDFEDDLILNTNHAFNEVAQKMHLEVKLDDSSPISRYLFNIDINQEEVIYIMLIDENVSDYYTFMKQFVNQGDTKSDILLKINAYNSNLITTLKDKIIMPGETLVLDLVMWADYEQLINPNDYLEFSCIVTIDLSIISAYGEGS